MVQGVGEQRGHELAAARLQNVVERGVHIDGAVDELELALGDAGEVEESDTRLPVVTLARTIDKDFHGFGRFRGGVPSVEISAALAWSKMAAFNASLA